MDKNNLLLTAFENSVEIQYLMEVVNVDSRKRLRVVAASNKLYEYARLKKEQVIGRFIDEVFPPDILNVRNAKFIECVELKKILNFKTSTHWNDGAIFSQSLTVTPIVDENALCTHLLVRTKPLSEANKLEKELKKDLLKSWESLAYLKSFVDAGDIAFWGTNAEGIIQEFNSGAINLLGYKREEVIGKYTPMRFIVSAELAQRQQELNLPLEGKMYTDLDVLHYNCLRTGQTDLYRYTLIRKDKTQFIAEIAINPIKDSQGTLVGFATRARDVSNEVANNNKIQHFFQVSQDLFCITNMAGKYLFMNDALIKELGYSKEELETLRPLELVHADDIEGMVNMKDRLNEGQSIFDYENRYKTKAGEYIWINWHAVRNETDGLMYATGRNITHKKAELEQYQQVLETLRTYQMALDKMAMVLVVDAKGHIISVNDNFAHVMGYH